MTKAITFGYLYDLRNPAQWHRPWVDLYAEALEFISFTEGLGFEAAWVPEHHGAEDGYLPSPLVMLGAIAARTKRMKIGSGIALAPFYHPVRFAEDCAILDILANGRLQVGVALGYRRLETDAYGIDFRSRAGRMDEFLGIVRRLWAGETVSCEGRHFNLKNAFIKPRSPRGQIPLFVGGFSGKALERAARYGDGYFGNLELSELYREKLRATGKNPLTGRLYLQSIFLVVAKDPEKAMNELAPYYHHVNNVYGQWLSEEKMGIQVDEAPQTMTLEQFKSAGMLRILTPDQAIALFKTMRAQAPLEHVMLMVPPGFPLSKFAQYAEVLAREVMPALRDL